MNVFVEGQKFYCLWIIYVKGVEVKGVFVKEKKIFGKFYIMWRDYIIGGQNVWIVDVVNIVDV